MAFPKSRGQRRAFNQLLAALRRQGPPREHSLASRAADRTVVHGLITLHGRFSAVREALRSQQTGGGVIKKYCATCGMMTHHRGDLCCSYRQHVLMPCESCDKDTPRDHRTRQCLEPGHSSLVQKWCDYCTGYRMFSPKTDCCLTCRQKAGSSPPPRRSFWR